MKLLCVAVFVHPFLFYFAIFFLCLVLPPITSPLLIGIYICCPSLPLPFVVLFLNAMCVFPVLCAFWYFDVLPLFSVAFWTLFLPDGIKADFFELLLFLQVDILSATQPFLDKKSRKCEQ